MFRAMFLMLVSCSVLVAQDPPTPAVYLQFDGMTQYVEAPDSTDFSVSTTRSLTVSAWMRPDTLSFPRTEGMNPIEQFVHWIGKGAGGQREWALRMYSLTEPPGPRDNRISFYVFNLIGGRGCGSYFQDPMQAGDWVHVVATADMDSQTVAIYKNGVFRHSDSFSGTITPEHGTSPLRMATRDFASWFQGALAKVRIWNRLLIDPEIGDLYAQDLAPLDGLVAEWLLNEGGGDDVFDTTGVHNGRVIGGATWGFDPGVINMLMVQQGGGC